MAKKLAKLTARVDALEKALAKLLKADKPKKMGKPKKKARRGKTKSNPAPAPARKAPSAVKPAAAKPVLPPPPKLPGKA